jgi:hypothetical protein
MSKPPYVAGHKLKKGTTVRWDAPRPVRHFVYTIRQATNSNIQKNDLPQHSLMIFKVERSESPPAMLETVEQMKAYVGNLAKTNPTYPGRGTTSNVGIFTDEQCWVILELAPDVNWRFAQNQPAVTTKEEEVPFHHGGVKKEGFNSDLHYAYDGGKVVEDPEDGPSDKRCRFVFFRVVRRDKDEKTGMNFVVEFYRAVTNGVPGQVIPLIIDPDVPDDGQPGFPDPP